MKTNLIIGAGQLGSRHLQGLLKAEYDQTIYVLDPSPDSLDLSHIRAGEISNKHQVRYVLDWNELPHVFDLVIIATGAHVRRNITVQLLENYKVSYIVFEKVLFQDIESYNIVEGLLDKTGTKAWVNHPRRMWKHFQEIKETIASNSESVAICIHGGNWGLACNALHYIDLCVFLSGSSLKELDMEWVENEILESKRLNCIELVGTIKGQLQNRGTFTITSFPGEIGDVTVSISTETMRWIIQEGRAEKIITISKKNNFEPESTIYKTLFQSSLSNRIFEELVRTGDCELTKYAESMDTHVKFIDVTLDKYNKIAGINSKICPIT